MAQLTLDLSQFKSAGVYTLEIDETVSYTVETNALRLLVGFSAKGPFNKPVFLRDTQDAETVYGGINEKLEHKGSYFNRFAETLTKRTPIFALNLLKVDEQYEGPDQVNYAALSLDAGKPNPAVSSYNKKVYGETDYSTSIDGRIYGDEDYNENATVYEYEDAFGHIQQKKLKDLVATKIKDSMKADPSTGEYADVSVKVVYGSDIDNGIPYIGNAPYASLFDRSRFWEPSEENLLATAALGLKNEDTVTFEHTNFFNIANTGTTELSVLIFKPENLSGYAVTCNEWYNGKENIPYGFIRPNDYVEDYFIQVVAVKGNWSNYNQLATDTVWSDYFDAKGIKKNKINSFISAAGVTLVGSWIGSIIPGFQNKNGEFVDIVTKINNNTTITGLLATFNKDAANILAFDYDGYTDDEGNLKKTRGWFIDDDESGDIDESESQISESTYQIDMVGHNFQNGYNTGVEYQAMDASGNFLWEDGNDEDGYGIPLMKQQKRYGINFLSYNYDTNDTDELLEPIKHAELFKNVGTDADGNGPVKDDVLNLFIVTNADEADKLLKGDLVNNDPEDETIIPGLTKVTAKNWISLTASEKFKTSGTQLVTNAKFTYKGTEYTYTGEAIYDKNFGKVGFYIYTTIESVQLSSKTTDNDETSSGDDASVSYKYVTKQHKISDSIVSEHLKFLPLKGLKITKRHMPGYDENGNIDVEGGLEKIYSMLSDKGINRGLRNRQMITYRYIIDSMSHGIAPMMGGKVYISQLAKKKGKCTALLNAPSKAEFAKSANPYFCDTFVNGVSIKPAFNTEYIAKGGNDEIYGENKFSLPDEDNGATFTGVFFPNLIYSVNGKKVSVPPAADVANVLIRKFTGSDPYMICANNNGVISNDDFYGIEYPLDDDDRDVLEPFGINPIITRDGVPMIYGNQTTYQRVKSDLNKLHIRENLNTIEIAVDALLQNYVFLYNNAQTRADVVQKITPVLQAAQTSGAIDSFSIQCDEKNNTEEIISSDFGIVEVSLVFNHGMEKIVSVFRLKRKIS